jgi:hypothetical protein
MKRVEILAIGAYFLALASFIFSVYAVALAGRCP